MTLATQESLIPGVARRIPVANVAPNVICMITSEQEIPLSEAYHIAEVFIEKMKEAYGENVLPDDGHGVFYFELTVDEKGQITSRFPTHAEISSAKGYWSHLFQSFSPHRPNKNL